MDIQKKNYLTKNYKNINLLSIKSKIRSSTKEYSDKLIKELLDNNFDIVEVHNRPLILIKLAKKLIQDLYFIFIMIHYQ